MPYNIPKADRPDTWKVKLISKIRHYYRENRKKAWRVIDALIVAGKTQKEIIPLYVAFDAFEATKGMSLEKKLKHYEKFSLKDSLDDEWRKFVTKRVKKVLSGDITIKGYTAPENGDKAKKKSKNKKNKKKTNTNEEELEEVV